MKRYKAIIFDLDGTLLDTLADLAEGTNYALRVNGFPERTIDEIRRFECILRKYKFRDRPYHVIHAHALPLQAIRKNARYFPCI